MATIGADAVIAVDADQDARVLRERRSLRSDAVDVEDRLVSETSHLLPATADSANEESDFLDSINKPWLGSREFDAKPRWRRPSVCPFEKSIPISFLILTSSDLVDHSTYCSVHIRLRWCSCTKDQPCPRCRVSGLLRRSTIERPSLHLSTSNIRKR